MAPFSIRRAGPADVPAIARVVNAAFEVESFFVDGPRTDEEEIRGMLGRGAFLLAEDGGVLAGCVFLEIRPAEAYFGLLSVDPARQGEGLGRRLVEAAEAEARAAGRTEMEICVIDLRTELPPFYRRLGYVETGVVPVADAKLKRPCRFLVMRKPLTGAPPESHAAR